MNATKEKSKKRWSGLAVILIMVIVLTWFNHGFAKEEETWKKEIRVPFITCITGGLASWGKILLYGAQIAGEEINAKGGVNGMKFVLDVSDDGSDPAQAAILVRRVQPKALAIMGPHLSSTAETGVPLGNSLKVPIMACCASKSSIATESRPWSFLTIPAAGVFYNRGIELFLQRETVKRAVVLTDKEDAAGTMQAGLAIEGLKKNGVTVIEEIASYRRDIDPGPVITRVKSLNPDAIIIATLPEQAGSLVKEIARQSLGKKVYVSQCGWTPDMLRIAGSSAEGVYGILLVWTSDPKFKGFVAKCKEKSGGPPPNICSFTGYELTWFLAQAMERAKITNDPQKQKEERERLLGVFQTMERDGLYGKWKFGQDGLPTFDPHLLRVQGGQEIEVK